MLKKKKTIRAGLTLIELTVAIAAVSIVFFAAAVMVVFGQKSWNREWEQANLQRDASYAMLKMKQSINSGKQAQLDADEMGVKIFQASGWIKYRYFPNERDLRYQIEGDNEQTLLDGIVEDMTFGVDPNTNKMVLVDIELRKGTCGARLSSKTMMRNYGT